MVDVLKKYLANQQQISIKGIGTISVEQLPARVDFPNQLLHSPETILYFSKSAQHDDAFCKWLSRELKVPETQAINSYNSFAEEMLQQLNENKKMSWDGVGEFVKSENGLINFTPSIQSALLIKPVTAKKVIRKGTEHAIRVGEKEKTNTEMQGMLLANDRKLNRRWWIPAVILLLAGIIAVLIYFSNAKQKNMHSNQNKPTITESPILYKIQ